METRTKIIIAAIVIIIIVVVIIIISTTINVTTMSTSDITALYDSVKNSNPDYNDMAGSNYYIKNYGSSLFLSVSDSTLSAQTETTTRWYIHTVSTSVYTISSMETPSKFLTSMGNGKSLQLLESNESDAQKWFIQYLLEISSGSNLLHVIVPLSNSTSTLSTSGNNVIQSVFSNVNTEKWFITTQISNMV